MRRYDRFSSQTGIPEEPDVLPRADAIVVFPATVNTLNKWALGIMDTLALGLLCEYMGMRMPVLAIPCVLTGSGLDSHPAFSKSMAFLKECGVHVIYEPEKYPPKNEVPCRLSPCITHEHVSVLGDERAWLWQAVSSCVGFHETVWVGVALRNGYMREMSVATYDQHTFAAWNLRAFHDTPFLDTST